MTSCLRLLASLSLSLALATAGLAQEKYRPGDAFGPFSAPDQHGRTYTSDATLRLVIVAFAMEPAKAANAFFARQPSAYLDEHHAVFISDIHSMPRFVRGFVIPKLRKNPHRILLAESAGLLARFPFQNDRLTVLRLDDQGHVAAIDFIAANDLAATFTTP